MCTHIYLLAHACTHLYAFVHPFILSPAGDRPATMHAQAYISDWYARYGWVRTGDTFDEAGIAHVTMNINV